MATPFIGEIRIFGCNFAVRGWALCNGQLLPIAQNTALFSILGTTFGGDGRTTFGLPSLQGRVPMHWGTGPGLTPRQIGEKSGAETALLPAGQMPTHSHTLFASDSDATSTSPGGNLPAGTAQNTYGSPGNPVKMSGSSITTVGGAAHNNVQPFQVLNFLIALQGVFPSRN
jgi:microcystin-dependent protein